MSHEIPTKFEHNGASYYFDIRDADCAERFNDALRILGTEEKALPKDGAIHLHIKGQCDMVKNFFDNCLCAGAGDAICTEKSNIRLCYDAYEAFLVLVKEQKEDILEAKNTFAKYSNRQQRRAAQHSKNDK